MTGKIAVGFQQPQFQPADIKGSFSEKNFKGFI